MPYRIDNMFVAAEQPHGAGTRFHGYSRLTAKAMGGREVVGSLVASDDHWSSPKIQVEGFALRQVTSAEAGDDTGADKNGDGAQNKCAVIAWEKDLDLRPIMMDDDSAGPRSGGLEVRDSIASARAWLDALTHKKAVGRVLIVVDDEALSLEQLALLVCSRQGQRPGYERVDGLAMTAASLDAIHSTLHGHREAAFSLWGSEGGDDLLDASARYHLVLVLGLQGTEERMERLGRLHGLVGGEGHLLVFSARGPARLIQETAARLGASTTALPADEAHSLLVTGPGPGSKAAAEMPAEVCLLLPSAPGAKVLALARAIEASLSTPKTAIRWASLTPAAAAGLAGKHVISLVEASSPTIYSWTEDEFRSFHAIVSTVSHLFWITKGGLLESWAGGVEFAPAQGLLRVLRNEYPLAALQHLDLSAAFDLAGAGSAQLVLDVWRASLHEGAETEFAELQGAIYIPRAVDAPGLDEDLRLSSGTARPQRRPITEGGRPMKLQAEGRGQHIWAEDDEANAPLEPDTVEIDVDFIGLGPASLSRAADGLAALPGLAQQAAGVVRRCGSNVRSVVPGQSVVVLQGMLCRTRVRQHQSLVAAVPEALKPHEVAALAAALVASRYALCEAARLGSGQCVLVHDAATVLGQAAIQVAQAEAADVFALVDSAKQKEVLMKQLHVPANRIFDSQRRHFVAAISKATSGRGVDAILASRHGPAVEASTALLADSGFLLDLSASSGTEEPGLVLPASKRNASLVRVDMGRVQQQKPVVVAALFQELLQGPLVPVSPTTVFSVGNAEQAVQVLRESRDAAVVLAINDEAPVLMLPPSPERLRLDQDATYVLAGGLGALGLNIANMMVDHGARHLVFLSRSAGSKNEEDLERFRSRGVDVEAHRCDVNDGDNVSRVFAKLQRDGRAIKGLVQCAMVLEVRSQAPCSWHCRRRQ